MDGMDLMDEAAGRRQPVHIVHIVHIVHFPCGVLGRV